MESQNRVPVEGRSQASLWCLSTPIDALKLLSDMNFAVERPSRQSRSRITARPSALSTGARLCILDRLSLGAPARGS